MDFPGIVTALQGAGFESYLVDYRRNAWTFYMSDGDSLVLTTPATTDAVAREFSAENIAAQVRAAQQNAAGYSYRDFSSKVKRAGCCGYMVSFPGRRVVYFGRTGETHTEHFPPASQPS